MPTFALFETECTVPRLYLPQFLELMLPSYFNYFWKVWCTVHADKQPNGKQERNLMSPTETMALLVEL